MLLSRKALFLGCGDYLPLVYQSSCTIVIIGRNTKNIIRYLSFIAQLRTHLKSSTNGLHLLRLRHMSIYGMHCICLPAH